MLPKERYCDRELGYPVRSRNSKYLVDNFIDGSKRKVVDEIDRAACFDPPQRHVECALEYAVHLFVDAFRRLIRSPSLVQSRPRLVEYPAQQIVLLLRAFPGGRVAWLGSFDQVMAAGDSLARVPIGRSRIDDRLVAGNEAEHFDDIVMPADEGDRRGGRIGGRGRRRRHLDPYDGGVFREDLSPVDIEAVRIEERIEQARGVRVGHAVAAERNALAIGRERFPVRDLLEGLDAGRKKVVAAAHDDEARQIDDWRDRARPQKSVTRSALVRADDWTSVQSRLTQEFAGIDPPGLNEFELEVDARIESDEKQAALAPVAQRPFWQQRPSISYGAAQDTVPAHVVRAADVAGIRSPDMGAVRAFHPLRIVGRIEEIVDRLLRLRAEVEFSIGRSHQRRPFGQRPTNSEASFVWASASRG